MGAWGRGGWIGTNLFFLGGRGTACVCWVARGAFLLSHCLVRPPTAAQRSGGVARHTCTLRRRRPVRPGTQRRRCSPARHTATLHSLIKHAFRVVAARVGQEHVVPHLRRGSGVWLGAGRGAGRGGRAPGSARQWHVARGAACCDSHFRGGRGMRTSRGLLKGVNTAPRSTARRSAQRPLEGTARTSCTVACGSAQKSPPILRGQPASGDQSAVGWPGVCAWEGCGNSTGQAAGQAPAVGAALHRPPPGMPRTTDPGQLPPHARQHRATCL